MSKDELTLDELDQVGTDGLAIINEYITAFEQGNMKKVTEMAPRLLNNPMFDDKQMEVITTIYDQAKQTLNNKEETKGFGL